MANVFRFVKRVSLTSEQHHSKFSGRQPLSLRWCLVLLVAGTLLPVVLFAIVVAYQLSVREQAASERRILLAARNLSQIIERELSSTTRTLQALASSESLSQGDLKAFYYEATRVVESQPSWVTVILLSPEGQQLANTIQPLGQPLPKAAEIDSLQRVVETRQRTIGNLSRSPLKPGMLGVPVRVPVMQAGKLRYVLTGVINQTAIAQVVNEQPSIDGEWTRTVVDGQGIVVARTRDPERFVGQRGTSSFLRSIQESEEGVYPETTLEGVPVYRTHLRS